MMAHSRGQVVWFPFILYYVLNDRKNNLEARATWDSLVYVFATLCKLPLSLKEGMKLHCVQDNKEIVTEDRCSLFSY